MKTTSFRFILAALAATAALVGCTKEITPNSENDKVNPEGSRIIAVSFAPQTKTTLDGFQPRFADGDSILLCAAPEDEDSDIKTDICRVDVDDEGNATISTNLTGCLGALYPAKFVKSDEGELDIIIPSVQSGKFSDANICRAVMEGEDDTSLHFENECSILKFYVDESIGVKSIEIINSGWDDIASGSRTITVEAPEDKTLYDVMPSEGQDRRICYVALDCAKDRVRANELTFKTETTTQGPVTRIPTESSYLQVGYMYNVFLPYYIEVNDQKWAYCNVGAFLPEEPGKYFAWGDTNGQTAATSGEGAFAEEFSWTNCPFNNGSPGYDQNYFNTDKQNEVCPGGVLTKEYDAAANANWGEGWRMPTKEEFGALLDLPTKSWKEDYNDSDANGYLFTDGNSNSIFLPAAGCSDGTALDDAGDGGSGSYWSSSLYIDSSKDACFLLFYDGNAFTSNKPRYYGQPVRALYDAPAPAPTVPEGFVDLGVKDVDGNPVYWAERNLGASKPEEYGTYFSWGETGEGRSAATLEINAFTTKPFGWDQDVFGQTFNNGISQSEACPSGVLAQAYDVAYQTNSVWRMPTKEDFTGLAKQCFLEWTDNYKGTTNVKGVIVWKAKDGDAGWFKPSASGKGCKIKDDGSGYKDSETHTFSNAYAIGTDSHVFFPAAGIGHGSDLVGASDGGYYWSSSLYTDNTDNAYSLIFESGNVYPRGYFARYYGFSVRPVSD